MSAVGQSRPIWVDRRGGGGGVRWLGNVRFSPYSDRIAASQPRGASRHVLPVSQSMMPMTALVDVMSIRDIGSRLMPNCAPSSGRMKNRPISISKP